MKNINPESYPFVLRPLDAEEGGGYLITFPDFNECISDGENEAEAIRNGRIALAETIAALEAWGNPIPLPGSKENVPPTATRCKDWGGAISRSSSVASISA